MNPGTTTASRWWLLVKYVMANNSIDLAYPKMLITGDYSNELVAACMDVLLRQCSCRLAFVLCQIRFYSRLQLI